MAEGVRIQKKPHMSKAELKRESRVRFKAARDIGNSLRPTSLSTSGANDDSIECEPVQIGTFAILPRITTSFFESG